jgi:hypothetical protein
MYFNAFSVNSDEVQSQNVTEVPLISFTSFVPINILKGGLVDTFNIYLYFSSIYIEYKKFTVLAISGNLADTIT